MSYEVNAKSLEGLMLGETNSVASVLQNIAIILSTFKGSVPLYRNFGINSRSIDKPIHVAKPMLVIDIEEAIREYEPRASIVNITFEADENVPGKLIPTLEVDINE